MNTKTSRRDPCKIAVRLVGLRDVTAKTITPVLPAELDEALLAIGLRLKHGPPIEQHLDRTLRLLNELPPGVVAKAEGLIRVAARLHYHGAPERDHRGPERDVLYRLFAHKLTDLDQLERQPSLKYLFIFHADGRIREAALQKMIEPLPSPFIFAAVAWRLNDWAAPVRKAAVECGRRTFPVTANDVIAGAATELLAREGSWRRWRRERTVLDEAFGRPDVAVHIAGRIAGMRTGPAATVLRHALRRDWLDRHLQRLSREAFQPGVRSLALQALIDGHSSRQTGFDWQWVDKTMGIRRYIPTFELRPLAEGAPRKAMIMAGLLDRSAAVRKTALDGLIRYRAEIPEAAELAAPALADRTASVRERAEFIMRANTKPA